MNAPDTGPASPACHQPRAGSLSPAADLLEQRVRGEEALVDAVARAVVELALLPLLRLDVVVQGGVEDHHLGRDAARLGEEALALVLEQVAVEVAGEDAVEGVVVERQRDRVALHGAAVRQPRRRDLHHRLALVEPDHVAAQVAGDERRAAGDVEDARRLQRPDGVEDRLDLIVPAGPLALGEDRAAEPPVVVLGGPLLVVGPHRLVDDALPRHASDCRSAV
jgi:hypothetical protein